jgi:hypothetical protein
VLISVVKCSWVKCSEVLQCSDVLLILFLLLCIWLYVMYTFVKFCKLCILIVMFMYSYCLYSLFCIFCFHCDNWHSPTTLIEVFLCFFLSCKANARVYLTKTGHGPHSSKSVKCVVLCIVCVQMCTVLLPPGGNPIAVKYISYHQLRLCFGFVHVQTMVTF